VTTSGTNAFNLDLNDIIEEALSVVVSRCALATSIERLVGP
jgi:hypothetical protein